MKASISDMNMYAFLLFATPLLALPPCSAFVALGSHPTVSSLNSLHSSKLFAAPTDDAQLGDCMEATLIKRPPDVTRFVTAGLLRGSKTILLALQESVAIDLKKWLEDGSLVEYDALETITQLVQDTIQKDTEIPEVRDAFERKRIGTKALVTQVLEEISKVKCRSKLEYQQSFAMVHTGASGIGKTFSAMCLPKLLAYEEQKLTQPSEGSRFVLAYLGFNVALPLTERETTLLRMENDQNSNSDAQPLMPLHLEIGEVHAPLLDGLHKLNVAELIQAAQAIIARLHDEIGRTTIIVVNVDEAQMLDQLVPIEKSKVSNDKRKTAEKKKVDDNEEIAEQNVGARYALRALRVLQAKIFLEDRTTLLVPVATGLNPYLSLSDRTYGRNVGVTSPMVSRDEFARIAEDNYPRMDKVKRDILADVMYPRVRELLDDDGYANSISSSSENLRDAPSLLKAGLGGPKVHRALIPRLFSTWDSDGDSGRPVLDAMVWPWLCSQLRIPVSSLPLSFPFNMNDELSMNCWEFEKMAAEVIAFTLTLFGHLGWGAEMVKELEQKKGVALNVLKLDKFLDIFDYEIGEGPCKMVKPAVTKKVHQPFAGGGGQVHEVAYASALSPEFEAELRWLKTGSSFVFLCGGSAPVDYVIVHRGLNNVLDFRYGDSKHSEAGEKLNARDVDKVVRKAAQVHQALLKKIPKLGMAVSKHYKVFLISNVDEPDRDDIVFLSPNTFKFTPWTNILFKCPTFPPVED